MTTETYVRPGAYAYPLISWGAVVAGAVIALALSALFILLGVAVGATAFNPFDISAAQVKGFTIGAGLWLAFANLVALEVGGWVAARSSRYPDHASGMLHGLAVWAVALIAASLLFGSGAAGGLVGPGAARHAEAVSASALDSADAMTADERAAMTAEAKRATETIAWWAVATMALGLVGAVAGGRMGSVHPAWPDRPRMIITREL
jgi:hypothetical protein